MNRHQVTLLAVFIFTIAQGQKITREQYIETYKDVAMEEMRKTGIPASIKLAQGILESGNGNSTLATKGNNHFGIKCHSSWKGKRIYHDDDKKNECFRKYKSASESFYDHSQFLVNTSRYDFLFELKPTDYKGWAKGLKKAGYATSNSYATALIRIIDENKLYQYDEQVLAGKMKPKKKNEVIASSTGREMLINNSVKYIIATSEDNLASLTKEFELFTWELPKYNDFEQKGSNEIEEGDIIYLQPKRSKASVGNKTHTVLEGESIHSISQQYAIRVSKLRKLNNLDETEELEIGELLSLRKKVKTDKSTRKTKKDNFKPVAPAQEKESNDEEELEIIFDPG
jgi:hypothetical protein